MRNGGSDVRENCQQSERRGQSSWFQLALVGGDIVGRDKITGVASAAALDEALRPLSMAIETAPIEARAEARRN